MQKLAVHGNWPVYSKSLVHFHCVSHAKRGRGRVSTLHRCKSGLLNKPETLKVMPNYMGVQISALSARMCLESGEWNSFTVK